MSDVAGRTAHAQLAGREGADAGARLPRDDRARSAASRRGHGGLSRERSRRHAARAAEQSALQSRPARAQRAAHVRAAGSAVRRRRRIAWRSRISATACAASSRATASWRRPNVVAALRAAEEAGVPYEPEQTVYVVGRENPVFAVGSGMPLWRKRLFAFMGRNSQLAAIHFGVPSHRLLEVSSQVSSAPCPAPLHATAAARSRLVQCGAACASLSLLQQRRRAWRRACARRYRDVAERGEQRPRASRW